MTHPPEVMAMARRCAAAGYVGTDNWQKHLRSDILAGHCDDGPVVKAAALAIVQTTEMAAAYCERDIPFERDGQIVGRCSGDALTATALRTFTHLTTKGDGE